MVQDGKLDTARVILYLWLPEYKSILAGREGVKMGVYLPDYTLDEVNGQVRHAYQTKFLHFCLPQIVRSLLPVAARSSNLPTSGWLYLQEEESGKFTEGTFKVP